jgi:hypothetical protein
MQISGHAEFFCSSKNPCTSVIRNSPSVEDYSMDSAIPWARLTDGKRGSPTMPLHSFEVLQCASQGRIGSRIATPQNGLAVFWSAERWAVGRPQRWHRPVHTAPCFLLEGRNVRLAGGVLAKGSGNDVLGASACELAQSRCATCYGNTISAD